MSFFVELPKGDRKMRYRALFAAAFCIAVLPGAASGAEIRVLSSWDKSYPVVPRFLEVYLKNVETASQIILRQPVGPSGDLQGRKIRGTVTYAGVFNLLGASPVVLAPADIYTSLEKGVVDGAGWPVLGVLDYRWYEVAKYIVRPTFGMLTYPIFMNMD